MTTSRSTPARPVPPGHPDVPRQHPPAQGPATPSVGPKLYPSLFDGTQKGRQTRTRYVAVGAGTTRVVAWSTVMAAMAISTWSLLDQAIRLAGRSPLWSDPAGSLGSVWRAFVIFGAVAMATLAVSLHATVPTLPIGRVGRVAGRILFGSYVTLAAVYALNAITGLADGGIGRSYQVIGGSTFVVMFLCAVPLGTSLLHHRVHRGAGVLFVSAVPTTLVTAAVGAATGGAFAHPALGESFIYLATALLALRSPWRKR